MKWQIFFVIVLSSCAVGPNYEPPEDTITGSWVVEDSCDISTAQDDIHSWWKVFGDEKLTKYIQKARDYNYDILQASSHILQARALRRMAASSFYPQISTDVNATKSYFSKNGPAFTFGTEPDTPGLPFTLQVPQIQNLFNLFFDATWEIDLFGKTRRAVEAADAVIGRTIEEYHDTMVTILAEVARNYIELRSSQKKEDLIKKNIELLQAKEEIIKLQFIFGYVNKLDVENIQASLFEEQSKLPGIKAQIHQNIYALSVLIGKQPENLLHELLQMEPLPSIPKKVAIGLKSDLLRRRPDIRRAERDLAAATANIGVAVAQFFPTISLLGDAGLQSLSLKKLFSLKSRAWAYGGDINLPIFQGGNLIGNLEAKRAETQAAGFAYQKTVLTALEEAEGTLTAYQQDLKSLEQITLSTEHYYNLVELSQARLATGLVNRLQLLDAELEYNLSEQTHLEVNTTVLLDLITLYKVLGGGWQIDTNSLHKKKSP